MHELPNDTVPWGSATAAASPDEDVPELGGWAADAIVGSAPSKKGETVSARSAAALATGLLRYGPHTALAVCLIAVAWMVGSYFIGPARTVVQQESMQSVEMGQAAQKMAEEPSKATERVDRIGLKIAALLAAAPVADRSASAAPVVRKRVRGGRGDAL